jgi:hypothetical protein
MSDPLTTLSIWPPAVDTIHPNAIYEPVRPMFEVRRIRNGFVLAHSGRRGELSHEDFCATYKDIGDRVVACLVEMELKERGKNGD